MEYVHKTFAEVGGHAVHTAGPKQDEVGYSFQDVRGTDIYISANEIREMVAAIEDFTGEPMWFAGHDGVGEDA